MHQMPAFCVVLASSAGKPRRKSENHKRRRAKVFRPRTSPIDGKQMELGRFPQQADAEDLEKKPSRGWSHEYSREFLAICQAQFEVLAQIVNASQCVLYLRREKYIPNDKEYPIDDSASDDQDLEFIPVCTYPEHGSAMVVGEDGQPRLAHQRLPGGVSATSLVPEYPYLAPEGSTVRQKEDGSLVVPVMSGHDLIGMLTIWKGRAGLEPQSASKRKEFSFMDEVLNLVRQEDRREAKKDRGGPGLTNQWTDLEIERVTQVASTLALACLLDQRTQESERSRQEQLKVLAQLRSLLSTVLHQVKSPLGALVTFGKLLLRRLPVGDVSRDLARDILIQSERMQELLVPLDGPSEEQLDQRSPKERRLRQGGKRRDYATDVPYFELEAAKDSSTVNEVRALEGLFSELEMRRCWLSELILPAVDTWRTLSAEASLRLIPLVDEDAPPCLVDARAVVEVMNNLVDNAIAYTPSPGTIEVSLAPTADEQGVVFRVRDTGYGVSKDEVDLVFDRGFRGSAAEKCELEMGGKGLGLYIAKEIVERMNGKIFLESPSGIGGVLPGTSTSVVFGRSVVASSKQE
mmetsp:Transcript_36114/g.144347  ORF Transcript_36114/g.144347 Transcript_36114/m.144347 type:complete len:576 (-) Transcript_36114:1928-3655(-)|eukprot:CAMPEP_0113969764 /NCGR_PEP_ID=MMETSP0011_2-20120614/10575_1 /TAXON_ID=101924 /ORGANISM="Rhodosorus marinus" /LENGTH=575 /DNA_ID=CAMNT_0000983611 /DNA_START=272 /DNA_END=1999 /DNA_ORIENTATION=- /assembly_acc=CAM_ASM_000156